MRVLQSWVFVNGAALTVGLASVLLWTLPPKMAAEPDLRNYLRNALLAGFVWLLLAAVRFLMVSRERNS